MTSFRDRELEHSRKAATKSQIEVFSQRDQSRKQVEDTYSSVGGRRDFKNSSQLIPTNKYQSTQQSSRTNLN
jgi:hypothetical protein